MTYVNCLDDLQTVTLETCKDSFWVHYSGCHWLPYETGVGTAYGKTYCKALHWQTFNYNLTGEPYDLAS